MAIKYIGAPIKEGCTIEGADQGIKVLNKMFDFAEIVEVKLQKESDNKHLLYLNTVVDFLWRLKKTVMKYPDDFVVTVGGDHSLAIGSISACYQDNLGLIWVDSHGDSNTDKTTISGRIHGMPLSVLEGLGAKDLVDVCEKSFLDPKDIVLFGISSLDELEKELIEKQHIKVIYYQDIEKRGLQECLDEVVTYLADKKVYISYDLDGIDPLICTGVNTPVKVGLDEDDAYHVLDELFKRLSIVGMDLVEYNPLNDDGNTIKIISRFKEIIEHYKG